MKWNPLKTCLLTRWIFGKSRMDRWRLMGARSSGKDIRKGLLSACRTRFLGKYWQIFPLRDFSCASCYRIPRSIFPAPIRGLYSQRHTDQRQGSTAVGNLKPTLCGLGPGTGFSFLLWNRLALDSASCTFPLYGCYVENVHPSPFWHDCTFIGRVHEGIHKIPVLRRMDRQGVPW